MPATGCPIHSSARITLALLPFFVAVVLAVQPKVAAQDRPAADLPLQPPDPFAEIARRVPAFGGLYLDEANDTIYAYLVPGYSGDIQALDRALTDVLGPARPPQQHIRSLQGTYTYAQLQQWFEAVTPHLAATSGVVFLYIDDPHNLIRIGVGDPSLTSRIEADLSLLDIPASAIVIERASPDVFAPFDPDAASGDNSLPPGTLRDRYRPLVGGIEIEIDQQGARTTSLCTLGFIATRDKVSGFVTAGHCMKDASKPKAAVYFQPSSGRDNRVGVGEISPPTFGQKNPSCLEGEKCRYSDSTFVKLDDRVESSQGLIARPAVNSSEWNGTDTFKIVGKARPVFEQKVTMVGAKSGRLEGIVKVAKIRRMGTGNGVTYLDQTVVSWTSKAPPVAGDSGSPAFVVGRNNEVDLLGLVWGPATVSPIDNIEITEELGPTLLVCATGSKC
jgi:hypothetical protein